MLTAVSLLDELCRAKPGILVAASLSAKLCFDFERIFCCFCDYGHSCNTAVLSCGARIKDVKS